MKLNRKRVKKALGIKAAYSLSFDGLRKSWRERIGPHIYKKKYSAVEVVEAMKRAGLKEGCTVFIQSGWGEFYNCSSTETELIEEILRALGPEGTLAMSSMPWIRKNKMFDVRKTMTKAGALAEYFRIYPGVKRSVHIRHSVCAIGPNADYLLSEHHLGETAWDEKSPYYKLSRVNALVFGLGLGKYWVGTIIHCVDSMLKNELPYYHDLFDTEKTEFKYVDYDGKVKSYWNYDMPQSGPKNRIGSYFKNRSICRKYLTSHYQQVSNLQISCWEAKEVVPKLIELGRKGINSNLFPSTRGYVFFK